MAYSIDIMLSKSNRWKERLSLQDYWQHTTDTIRLGCLRIKHCHFTFCSEVVLTSDPLVCRSFSIIMYFCSSVFLNRNTLTLQSISNGLKCYTAVRLNLKCLCVRLICIKCVITLNFRLLRVGLNNSPQAR